MSKWFPWKSYQHLTIEEYEKLDLKYIESQAYGSWMDGAR